VIGILVSRIYKGTNNRNFDKGESFWKKKEAIKVQFSCGE
jgi:hypothetical protein